MFNDCGHASLRPCVLRPCSPQQRPQKGHGKSGEKERKESRRGKATSGSVPPRSLRSPVQAATQGTSKFLPACCPVLGEMFHSVSPLLPLYLLFVSCIHTRSLAGHYASLQVCLVCLCASCILCFSLSGSHPLIAHPHPLTRAHIHAGVRIALYPLYLHIVIHTQYQVTPLHAAVSCGARKKSTPMSVIPLVPAPCAMPPQDSILAF